MSAAKHTDGPWFSDTPGEVLAILPGGAVVVIADVNPLDELDDATEAANTCLVVAAPDLLAFAVDFVKWHNGRKGPLGARAAAAIAKALGAK